MPITRQTRQTRQKTLREIMSDIERDRYSWLLRTCQGDEPRGYFAHVFRGDPGASEGYCGEKSRQPTAALALESAYLRAKRSSC